MQFYFCHLETAESAQIHRGMLIMSPGFKNGSYLLIFVSFICHVESFSTQHLHTALFRTNRLQLKLNAVHKKEQVDSTIISWSPQDLDKETPGYPPIPQDDYIHQYQKNPDLWPIEFFILPYRRQNEKESSQRKIPTTQILVRKSSNGTAKYGLGTGMPLTRWLASSQVLKENMPQGYKVVEPILTFDAKNFPEFPESCKESSWKYTKIEVQVDAFQYNPSLKDEELENYAKSIQQELLHNLSQQIEENKNDDSFYSQTISIIQSFIHKSNCVAAIQGSLRMSGLFEYTGPNNISKSNRYVNLDETRLDPKTIISDKMRIYTMFPQMPDPLPLPSTSSQELTEEIRSRPMMMEKTGRDPHKDKYGRCYTHISTSNVSNTIHGIYLCMDVTDLISDSSFESDDIDIPPALNPFGTERIDREWVSLEDLKVQDYDAKDETSKISTIDPKATFISGFIVRQLVKEGIIQI